MFFENIYYITYPPTILVRMVMCFWFCPNLGSTTGTRFRPLSLNIPKPLFPIAGQPMVHHPISACKRVCFISLQFQFSTLDQWMMMMRAILYCLQIPNLAQIYLVGFYEEREFALYVSAISNELKVPVRFWLDPSSFLHNPMALILVCWVSGY